MTLSACETGLGTYSSGEGIMSLGRAFLESGAKSCLITLWSVDDKSTAEIMTSFYENLRSGDEKDKALHKAKIDYVRNADPVRSSPYYWAGFILIGDTQPLFKNNNYIKWSLFLLFFILTIILIHQYLKNRI